MRRFVAILVAGLCTACCFGATPSTTSEPGLTSGQSQPNCASVQDCEVKIRGAEAAHAPDAAVAELYHALANAEHEVGNLPSAEWAMERAAKLQAHGPQEALAEVLSELAALHVQSGKIRIAEKELNRVLKIRENAGDRLAVALAWNDLAELNLSRGQFEDSLRYAQKASAVLGDNAGVSLRDRIAVRQTLGNALCGTGRYTEGIAVLAQASHLAETQVGGQSVDAGVAKFLLGSAYWRAGHMDEASRWMADGIAILKNSDAWGRAPYLHAMTEYVQFLRSRGDTDEALAAERDIRAANSVVSVAALAGH